MNFKLILSILTFTFFFASLVILIQVLPEKYKVSFTAKKNPVSFLLLSEVNFKRFLVLYALLLSFLIFVWLLYNHFQEIKNLKMDLTLQSIEKENLTFTVEALKKQLEAISASEALSKKAVFWSQIALIVVFVVGVGSIAVLISNTYQNKKTVDFITDSAEVGIQLARQQYHESNTELSFVTEKLAQSNEKLLEVTNDITVIQDKLNSLLFAHTEVVASIKEHLGELPAAIVQALIDSGIS